MTASLETPVSESSPTFCHRPPPSRLAASLKFQTILIPVLQERKLEPSGKITCSQVHLTCKSLRKDSVQAGPAREPILFALQHQASYGGRYADKMAIAYHRPQTPRPQRERLTL